jgi:NTP pyrophosphatase (non-canonical NTP hydrolase)
MLVEESAEFTVARNKLRRGNTEAIKQMEEELADVLVVALQLRMIIGEDYIDSIMNEKINRQLERMKEEEDNASKDS